MNRARASLIALLLLVASTATCTQLLGVEAGEPLPDGGAPLPKCPDGHASCRGQLCDTDISTDPVHCGGCGKGCVASNATAICAGSKCNLTCTQGFADCDGNGANGCEVFLEGDALNCGACGRDCHGTPCVNGACVPIVMGSAQSDVVHLEADEDFAYVSTAAGGVETFPIGGGTKTVAISDPTTIVTQLGYSEPNMVALRNVSGVPEIDALSRNGLGLRCVAMGPTVHRLTADLAGIVWSGSPAPADGGTNPLIQELPPSAQCDAGAPRDLAPTTGGKVGEGVVLDGATAFVTALDTAVSTTGMLARVDRASGAMTVLLPRIRPMKNGGRSLAVDDQSVYWVDSDVFVRRIPKAGCPSATPCSEDLYFEEFGSVFGASVDDKNVYVLGTDGSAAYLEVVDKVTRKALRRVPADKAVTTGDVSWNTSYVIWGLGPKVYRLSR